MPPRRADSAAGTYRLSQDIADRLQEMDVLLGERQTSCARRRHQKAGTDPE